MPVYIKADVEGQDVSCLQSLSVERIPGYFSVEVPQDGRDWNPAGGLQAELQKALLYFTGRGDARFKLAFQSIYYPMRALSFETTFALGGGSGPFGAHAVAAIARTWRSAEDLLRDVPKYEEARRSNWWDLHARLL